MLDILGLSSWLEETAGFSPLPLVWSAATSGEGGPRRTALWEPRVHSLLLPLQKCCHSQRQVTSSHLGFAGGNYSTALGKKVLFPLKIKRNKGHQKEKHIVDCSYTCHP